MSSSWSLESDHEVLKVLLKISKYNEIYFFAPIKFKFGFDDDLIKRKQTQLMIICNYCFFKDNFHSLRFISVLKSELRLKGVTSNVW